MQTSPVSQTSTTKEVLKHSSLGITAFTLTLIGDFFLLFALLIAAIAQSNGNEASPYFFVALYWIFIIPSTVMAIMDLSKLRRRKTLPKLALIFGIGMFVIVLLVVILATLLLVATK